MKNKYLLLTLLFYTFISNIIFAQNKSFVTDKTAFAACINVPKIVNIMSDYKPLNQMINQNTVSNNANIQEVMRSSFINLVLVFFGEIDSNDYWESMKHWEENGFVPVSNFDFIITEDSKAYAHIDAKINLKKFYATYKDSLLNYGFKFLKEENDKIKFKCVLGDGEVTSNGISIGEKIGQELKGNGENDIWKNFNSSIKSEDLLFAFEGNLNAFNGVFNPDDVLSSFRNVFLYFYKMIKNDADRLTIIVGDTRILGIAKHKKEETINEYLKSLKRYLAEQGPVSNPIPSFNNGIMAMPKVKSLVSTIYNKNKWLGVMLEDDKALEAGIKYIQAMNIAAQKGLIPANKLDEDTQKRNICKSNLQILTQANSMNMSNNMDYSKFDKEIDLNDFVTNGILDELPECPDGGTYSIKSFQVNCSKHGDMFNIMNQDLAKAKENLGNLSNNPKAIMNMFTNPKANCRNTMRDLEEMVKLYMVENNISDYSKVDIQKVIKVPDEIRKDMTEDVIKVMEDLYKCPEEGNYEILKTGKIKCSIHGTIED